MTSRNLSWTGQFSSILFERPDRADVPPGATETFADLNLDQIIASVIAEYEEYDLAPFFSRPLRDVEEVRYRHQVLLDLEHPPVLDAVRDFAEGMRRMRRSLALAEKLSYRRQKQRWFLDAADVYCETVLALHERLASCELSSPGFVGLRAYLAEHDRSDEFAALLGATQELKDELAAIRYAVHVKGSRVRVLDYADEADMSEEVERAFAKFRQGQVADHRVRFRDYADMNHIEAQILDLVARLNPDTFAKLEAYCAKHRQYLDETIGRFDREVQFYLSYLEYIAPLEANGLSFCYPSVSTTLKCERADDSFDLALAAKLVRAQSPVVANDFHLYDGERILVVSGPNNGGKTTFARMIGQLHHLASLGLPVPGRHVELFLPDRIFTHFEREETIETLRGKFEDELYRIHAILRRATGDSLLIMNESFGSSTVRDALLVGTAVMNEIIDLDALCVFVTFVDELASLGPTTVSMMSTVAPDDAAVRTFKVVRKAADGLAYAAAIATKYGLTYESLRQRIGR